MVMINNYYSYSREESILLEEIKGESGFDHTSWMDDRLLNIRSSVRRFYRSQQSGICVYCRSPLSLQSSSNCQVEHIIPKSKCIEFIFESKNMCVVCADCNEIKADKEVRGEYPIVTSRSSIVRYPRSSGAFKIIHPFYDDYEDHILKINNYYVDRTEKGHFTIGVCKLNRFVREFGVADEVLETPDINQLMGAFISTDNELERFRLLQRIKALIP